MADPTPVLTALPYDASGLTVAEAAQRLGIGPEAVRQRIRRGTLRSYKASGRVYVQLDAHPTPSERVYQTVPSERVETVVATPVPNAVPHTGRLIGEEHLATVVAHAVRGYREALDAVRGEVAVLQQTCDDLKDQLRHEQDAHRHDVDELLRLLEQAQQFGQPPSPTPPVDWQPEGKSSSTKRRRWWWPFPPHT